MITLEKKIKLNEFINNFTQILVLSTRAFMEVKNNKKEIKVFYKEENEKFTTLDWNIQKIIETHLNKHYSGIKIIGEEDTTKELSENSLEEFLSIEEKSKLNIIEEGFIEKEKNEYKLEDLCVYCDPIDGTSSLIKKQYEHTTILLGLTYKNSPILGLVHYFNYKNKETRTFMNVPGKGIYSLNIPQEEFTKSEITNFKFEKENLNKKEKMSFVVTATRENPTMTKSKLIYLLYSFFF